MDTKQIIADFIEDRMDIDTFMDHVQRDDRIYDYLQSIVDHIVKNKVSTKRRTVTMKGINQNKPFQMFNYIEEFVPELRDRNHMIYPGSPAPTVKQYLCRYSHKTARGALNIYDIVADIFYQVDDSLVRTDKYSEAHRFSLDVMPGYLGGIQAEDYISRVIIPKYPEDMKKTMRKNRIKEEIRTAFLRDVKGYPHWIQDPEWPLGENGIPMIYMGQKKHEEYTEYYFRGNGTQEKKTVRQCW
jgi:hypothetical protein